jgi:hypothetical protein
MLDRDLDLWRRRCDPLADGAMAAIEEVGERDLYAACRKAASLGDARARAFLEHVEATPPWVRPREHRLAHELFARNGLWILMLGFPVLVDSYAGAKDNKVLVMSGRLAGRGAFARLVETARFVLAVCTPGAIEPGREGWASAVRVRLLHAWVRRLCRRAGYDVARYDEPINQEAMCGTLMLFGHGTLTCLRRVGVAVTDREAESWHSLWRAIGRLLGVDEALLPETYAEEVALYDRIKAHQFHPDEDTRALFAAALREVARGARTAMPWWFTALGGWTLQSETFLEQLVVRTCDRKLSAHLGLAPRADHALMFRAVASSQRAFGAALHRSSRADRATRAIMGTLTRRLPVVLAGTREPPSYDDPGFSRRRAG